MDPKLEFTHCNRPTVGVELELQLVEQNSWALNPVILDVLKLLPDEQEWAKPELMQSYIEINSSAFLHVREVISDLKSKLAIVDALVKQLDTRIFWAATHPFSTWMEQRITPDKRYKQLVDKMQDTARRIVTFGMHVHVGVDSGDKAVMVIDRLMRHLPTLLALSVNSPFWVGRNTGLQSHRCKIMEQLPAAGLPPNMRNYSEYCWIVNHSIQSGFINSIREIWWDVRPHPRLGTVEVRICDLPPDMETVSMLTALIQCLVVALSEQIDEGVYQYDIHPIMVKQNKWKATRYGMNAEMTDAVTQKAVPVRILAYELYEKLIPYSKQLGCEAELNLLPGILQKPSGARRQLESFQKHGNFPDMIQELVETQIIEAVPLLSRQGK